MRKRDPHADISYLLVNGKNMSSIKFFFLEERLSENK